MAGEAKLKARRAILRARGVPDRFVDKLATRRGMPLLVWAFPVLLIAGFLAADFAVVAGSTSRTAPLQSLIGPFIFGPVGPHLLFTPGNGLVGFILMGSLWALIAGYVLILLVYIWVTSSRPVSAWPAYSPMATTLRALRKGETPATVKRDDSFAELAYLPDDRAFLQALKDKVPKNRARVANLAFVFAFLSFMAAVPGVQAWHDYQLVTTDTLEFHHAFKTQIYALKDAQQADVVCYADQSEGFQYRLVFNNRVFVVSRGFDTYGQLTRAQVIGRLVQLDQRLAQLGIPIHRMPSSGSPADDAKACIDHWAALSKSGDAAALTRLVFGS